MMQANELRKGNYVLYNTIGSVPLSEYRFEHPKELCRVQGFEEDKIILAFMDEKIRNDFSPEVYTAAINISPVHLTPEVVEGCQLSDTHFRLEANEDHYRYEDKVLKYLHQLQNLYADVTGQELRVDLTTNS
jgi:hypothetical protein